MELRWMGDRTVRLSGQSSKVLMEPHGSTGTQKPGGLVTYSHAASSTTGGQPDGIFVIAGPGEYEVDGVFVIGVAGGVADGSNTLYNVNIDGVNIVHPGMASQKLNQAQVEELGAVDVLVLPLGNIGPGAARAADWIAQLQPSIVVPLSSGSDPAGQLQRFLDAIGAAGGDARDLLQVQGNSLPEETQVVVLRPGA
jgi:L-ascorbate metabolism protein UlaG (beta-lactamase superfamily)